MTRGNFLETKRHFCFVPYYTQAHFAKKNSSNRIFWPKKIKLLLLGSPNTMNNRVSPTGVLQSDVVAKLKIDEF